MLTEKGDLFSQIGSLLNERITYSGIINKNGRIENVVYKNDINLNREKREMFCMGIRLQNCMQSDFDEDLGAVSYALVERGNSKFLSVPFYSFTILIIMDKNIDHVKIINKIKTMASNSHNVERELVMRGISS